MENNEKDRNTTGTADGELRKLQPTNKPGLTESTSGSITGRRKSQSTPACENLCAELSASIKQTLDKWNNVLIPLSTEYEAKLRVDYDTLKSNKARKFQKNMNRETINTALCF